MELKTEKSPEKWTELERGQGLGIFGMELWKEKSHGNWMGLRRVKNPKL
jgi:hypothetical protein